MARYGPGSRWNEGRRPGPWPLLGGSHLSIFAPVDELHGYIAQCPDAVTAAAEHPAACAFGLALIRPELPPFDVPFRPCIT